MMQYNMDYASSVISKSTASPLKRGSKCDMKSCVYVVYVTVSQLQCLEHFTFFLPGQASSCHFIPFLRHIPMFSGRFNKDI